MDNKEYEVIGIDKCINTDTIPNEKIKEDEELIQEVLWERGCYCETCNID